MPDPGPAALETKIVKVINRIKRQRGLTQRQVAGLVRRPQPYVSRVLTGTKKLTVEDVEIFAAGYGLGVEELITAALSDSDTPIRGGFIPADKGLYRHVSTHLRTATAQVRAYTRWGPTPDGGKPCILRGEG